MWIYLTSRDTPPSITIIYMSGDYYVVHSLTDSRDSQSGEHDVSFMGWEWSIKWSSCK